MESLFWGRTDYQDMDWRTSYAGQSHNQWPEWVWQGSQSLGKSAEVFAGELTSGGYGAPIDWHDQGGAIQDNPSRHDYVSDDSPSTRVTIHPAHERFPRCAQHTSDDSPST